MLERTPAAVASSRRLTEPPPASSTLDRSLVLGVAWTAGAKWATQIIAWACTFIIARILTPGDYGLFGMAMVYHGFVSTIYDLGLEDSIVRQRDLSDDQIARLGGMSLLLGVGFALVTLTLAAPIARFYDEPAVAWILRVLAISTVIEGIQMLPRARLARALRFRAMALVDAAGGLTLALSTLGFALAGLQYRSLAYAALASAFVTMSLTYYLARPSFARPRPGVGLRGPIHFGIEVMLSRVAWYIYTHADFAVISRALGKAALGAYTFGWTLATLPVDRFAALVGRVVPAVFAVVQKDIVALRRYWLGTTEGLAFAVLPVTAGLAVAADDIIYLGLGDQWGASVMPLRLLAIYGGFRALSAMIPPALIAAGHARKNLERTVLGAVVLPILFVIGSRWGISGVAAAWVIGYPLVSIPAYHFTFRLLRLNAADYARAVWPALSTTLAMVLVVIGVRELTTTWPLLARFLIEAGVGAATYLGLTMLLHRKRIAAFRAILRDVKGATPAPADAAATPLSEDAR